MRPQSTQSSIGPQWNGRRRAISEDPVRGRMHLDRRASIQRAVTEAPIAVELGERVAAWPGGAAIKGCASARFASAGGGRATHRSRSGREYAHPRRQLLMVGGTRGTNLWKTGRPAIRKDQLGGWRSQLEARSVERRELANRREHPDR